MKVKYVNMCDLCTKWLLVLAALILPGHKQKLVTNHRDKELDILDPWCPPWVENPGSNWIKITAVQCTNHNSHQNRPLLCPGCDRHGNFWLLQPGHWWPPWRCIVKCLETHPNITFHCPKTSVSGIQTVQKTIGIRMIRVQWIPGHCLPRKVLGHINSPNRTSKKMKSKRQMSKSIPPSTTAQQPAHNDSNKQQQTASTTVKQQTTCAGPSDKQATEREKLRQLGEKQADRTIQTQRSAKGWIGPLDGQNDLGIAVRRGVGKIGKQTETVIHALQQLCFSYRFQFLILKTSAALSGVSICYSRQNSEQQNMLSIQSSNRPKLHRQRQQQNATTLGLFIRGTTSCLLAEPAVGSTSQPLGL